MIRAILVPSRPGRTLVLSSLAFLPTVVVCIVRHDPRRSCSGPGDHAGHHYLPGYLRAAPKPMSWVSTSLEEKIGGGGMGEVWDAVLPGPTRLLRARSLD